VKVVAVPAASAKPSAVVAKSGNAKPAVISVQPAPVAAQKIAVAPQKIAVAQKVAVATQKNSVAVRKPAPASVSVKAAPAASTHPVVAAKPAAPASKTPAVKAVVAPVAAANAKDPFNKKKAETAKKSVPVQAKAQVKNATGNTVAVNEAKPAADDKKPEPKKLSAVAHRDPFVSPVVRLGSAGSGCSSGKRCLAIDQIALKGVVRSETGMIAVVVNSMSKAYFLRENDPVFNGYVTKITPDSIVFKETFHDKVGKPLTRDVTKTINRPAA
jgi:Tfp pilus assembly protein PilP